MYRAVATAGIDQGVVCFARSGVFDTVNPSVRNVGGDEDIGQGVLVDVEVDDNDAVGAIIRSVGQSVVEGLVLTIHLAVGSLVAGADSGVDERVDSVVNCQVHRNQAVAAILVLAIDSADGVSTGVVVGLAVEVPGVGVEFSGVERTTGVGLDSPVDSDRACAAVLGGPVGNGGAVVGHFVEGVGVGQVDGLASILLIDVGVVVSIVGTEFELAFAKDNLHLFIRSRINCEGEDSGRVAAIIVGYAGGQTIGLRASLGGSNRSIVVGIGLAKAYLGVDILVGLSLGTGQTQHFGTVAAVLGLGEGQRNVGVGAGEDVIDDRDNVAVGIIPGVRQTLVTNDSGVVLAGVDGHIVAAYNIAAVADGSLELVGTALVDLAFHEAAVAGNGVEDEDVADGGVGPSQGVGGQIEHKVQYLGTVATILVGSVKQIANRTFGLVHIVGDTVDPSIFTGVAPTDVVNAGVSIVHSQVEGHEAVATGNVGDSMLCRAVALGIGVAVNPDKLVADGLYIGTGGRGAEGEVHRDHTVATVNGLQRLVVAAGGGVFNIVPGVAVAIVGLEAGSLFGVDSEVEVVQHRADVGGRIGVVQRGDIEVSDVVGLILALAEGELIAFAVGAVGVGNTGGGDIEVQVDGTVASVADGPGLVIVAAVDVVESLCTPGNGEHSLAYR